MRMPMLLVSCGSVAVVYLVGKRLSGRNFGLLAMALTAVNPWHFMQSRWSLDCNLFPHVFLFAFYLLLVGLEKHWALYCSMVFFGLTLYCYGIAVYSVVPFLLAYGAWCLLKGCLKPGQLLLCAAVFTVIAMPELLVMAINLFGWPTVETPFFTLSYFPESVRSRDILFLNFSVGQMVRNVKAMADICFLQKDGAIYNALPDFGPMYVISLPFMLYGIGSFGRKLFRVSREDDPAKRAAGTALWGWLLMGLWVGVVTYQVNVNRINIIFYPLIFFCGYGIAALAKRFRSLRYVAAGGYAACFILFLAAYFTTFAGQIPFYFNENFLRVVKTADGMEGYDRLYITSNADWQQGWQMTEILTQYACRIDAAYYQGKTTVTGGRDLLPYSERYHFVDMEGLGSFDPSGLYLVHVTEMEKLPFPYEILAADGNYVILRASLEEVFSGGCAPAFANGAG